MSETKKPTILLVEDVLPQTEIYGGYLSVAGYAVTAVFSGREAIDSLSTTKYDALILDLHLPDITGFEVLQKAHELHPDTPVIVITADTSAQAAVEAMRDGAYDFIVKPFPAPRLIVTLRHAMRQDLLRREVMELRQSLGQSTYHGFVGQSAEMQSVYRVIESVAASKACVFITGESGTGKELAAQALHEASPRREKPFVAINCGAIPHELLESHIFGHVRGAFTGAVSNHQGAAKRADGGTLFLDEICDLPLDLQVKILRFLQTGDIAPVGSDQTEHLNIRIIAATNRDPLTEVRAGRFREDLYYRLHVVPIEMPALREREDDVVLLSDYFLHKYNKEEKKAFVGFDEKVLQTFRRHEWRGNVRELENVIHQIVAMYDDTAVRKTMLPASFAGEREDTAQGLLIPSRRLQDPANDASSVEPLWEIEKRAILHALVLTEQDVIKAAHLLEVSPSTLYRKLQIWKSETGT